MVASLALLVAMCFIAVVASNHAVGLAYYCRLVLLPLSALIAVVIKTVAAVWLTISAVLVPIGAIGVVGITAPLCLVW